MALLFRIQGRITYELSVFWISFLIFYLSSNNFCEIVQYRKGGTGPPNPPSRWVVEWFQIFYYTHCITPKRVTSLRGPSPCHCAHATQLLLKKCRSGGETLATLLCPIWPTRDLNLRPPAPETKGLPLDQLAGALVIWLREYCNYSLETH